MIRFVLFALLLPPTADGGQAHWCDLPQAHPIDTAFTVAIDRSGGVTVDMLDAQAVAWQDWDAELNRHYQALLRQLKDSPRADALRKAQRAWLAWDQAESMSDTLMQDDSGSAAPIGVNDQSIARRRERACKLYQWLDLPASP